MGTPEARFTEDRNTVCKVSVSGEKRWAFGLMFLAHWPPIAKYSIEGRERILAEMNNLPTPRPWGFEGTTNSDWFKCLVLQDSLEKRLFYKNGNPYKKKLPEVLHLGVIFPDELEVMYGEGSNRELLPCFNVWYYMKDVTR